MEWKGRRQSENVEDRRRISPRGVVAGGGIGTLLIVLLVMLLGGDPQQTLQQISAPGPSQSIERPLTPAEEEAREFVAVVLADTEDVWNALFRRMGRTYEEPRLVLFSGQVDSACGLASAAVGPFYCPPDKSIYIDLSFFDELGQRFGAPGDFAQAYVIAHEVGHHVQNLLGTMDQVNQARERSSQKQANELSVRLELQADYYAGVWAHHTQQMKQVLEPGDIDEAIRAAGQIGDDKLQLQAQGYVAPDSFTHGSSDQRIRWFRRGWESGDVSGGDTFRARRL